jgi:hypothetical protein
MPKLIEDNSVTREGKVTLVRLKLAGQPLARVFDNGPAWSLDLGEDAGGPPLRSSRSAAWTSAARPSSPCRSPASPASTGLKPAPPACPLPSRPRPARPG